MNSTSHSEKISAFSSNCYFKFYVFSRTKPGTGKTAAFGIGTLSRIDYGNKHCQALLLAPTRELAIQIQKVCLSLGDYVKVLAQFFETIFSIFIISFWISAC